MVRVLLFSFHSFFLFLEHVHTSYVRLFHLFSSQGINKKGSQNTRSSSSTSYQQQTSSSSNLDPITSSSNQQQQPAAATSSRQAAARRKIAQHTAKITQHTRFIFSYARVAPLTTPPPSGSQRPLKTRLISTRQDKTRQDSSSSIPAFPTTNTTNNIPGTPFRG